MLSFSIPQDKRLQDDQSSSHVAPDQLPQQPSAHHGYGHGMHPGYFGALPHDHDTSEVHPALLQTGSDKSHSPVQSATTAGTTATTEPSVGHGSPGEATLRENAPVYPSEHLATGIPENQVYLGMSPRYSPHPGVPYGAQPDELQPRYNQANYPAAMKLLVSNNVAGSVIGRQGQTISELQQKSSTRIKLSQTGDYYPGTQDRVCLVQGDQVNVKTALRLLLERIYMLQENQHSQHMAWQLQQQQKGAEASAFDFVVRLLVPSSSCGMIIGKSGSNIKFLEETTGVTSVRLSPKESGDQGFPTAAIVAATSERVLTVTGPHIESCVTCLQLILDGMVAHPDICRYTNMTTSYSRLMQQPDAMGFPGPHARPVMVTVPPISPRHVGAGPLWEGHPGHSTYGTPSHPASVAPRRITSSPDIHGLAVVQRQDGPVDRLQGGYNQGIGMPGHFSPIAPVPVDPFNPPVTAIPRIPSGEGLMHPNVAHSNSAPDLLAYQLEQSMHISPQPPSPSGVEYMVPVTPTCVGPNQFQAQILIPDSMIGSILGRGGRTLAELHTMTGTRIRISQRGEFLPGTRDRIVSIRGPSAQSIWQVQMMISQRIVLPPTATHSYEQQPHLPSPAPDPSQS